MKQRILRLSDIAALAGVSKATASRALSNPSIVSEDTRKRVLDVVQAHGYKPNAMAQAMARRRSNLIGFCLYSKSRPFFGHTFFGPVLDGVSDQAKAMNYHVVLATTDQMQDTFEERFIEDCIDGAIIASFRPREMIEVFAGRGIPLVVINNEFDAAHNGFVVEDSYGGARAMMDYLLGQKRYGSVAIVSDRLTHPSYMLRYLGYLDGLRAHGLAPYENAALSRCEISEDAPDFNRYLLAWHGLAALPVCGTPVVVNGVDSSAAREAVGPLLRCDPLPRAIFCTTDSIALGVMQAVRAHGLRIPEDIAVCGYDDVEAAATAVPPLTTIAVDRDTIGREAMKLLQKFIEDPTRPSETVRMGNRLVVRESA